MKEKIFGGITAISLLLAIGAGNPLVALGCIIVCGVCGYFAGAMD